MHLNSVLLFELLMRKLETPSPTSALTTFRHVSFVKMLYPQFILCATVQGTAEYQIS